VGCRRSVCAKGLGRFLGYYPPKDIVDLAVDISQYPVALGLGLGGLWRSTRGLWPGRSRTAGGFGQVAQPGVKRAGILFFLWRYHISDLSKFTEDDFTTESRKTELTFGNYLKKKIQCIS
jgi:hypothetical protein